MFSCFLSWSPPFFGVVFQFSTTPFVRVDIYEFVFVNPRSFLNILGRSLPPILFIAAPPSKLVTPPAIPSKVDILLSELKSKVLTASCTIFDFLPPCGFVMLKPATDIPFFICFNGELLRLVFSF